MTNTKNKTVKSTKTATPTKTAKTAKTTGHAQVPDKIQIPTTKDFMQDLDEANEKVSAETRHNYKLKRSTVARTLLKMYLSVADSLDANSIQDDETLKAAIAKAIKKDKRYN